jgi:hypothetical protein
MRRYAPLVAGLAGVSRQCVARLQADGAADAPSVDLLNYPVDVPDRARSQTAPRPADATGPLRLLYAGRLEESQKRISRLPELFRQLASAQIPFSASIAGDGPARASLEAQIAALPRHVASCIRLLGTVPHDDMARVLREHDVLVLVSAFEGTPLVLLEAMGSGVCPVLMELAGGLPELVRHDENACVVPQGAIAHMVEAIATLHGDRARLTRLGASARATVASRANPAAHSAWLRARLSALWERPAPQPDRVIDPDPLGCRVESLSRAALAAQPASVAVWGAGVVGRQIVDRLLSIGVMPAVMVDADAARHGSYRGVTVTAPSRLEADTPQIVCVGSVAFADEIVRALHGRSAPPLVLVP